MPFGVKSDPSFWAQKQRIRVRVSSFRTAETVFIDGPSMNSLMVSINEFIDGYPLTFIDGCPTMNIHGFPGIWNPVLWINYEKLQKQWKTFNNMVCLQAAGRFGLGVQSWFLSAAPAASPKIQNPWGGKSMGGKFSENPWTNPGFLETQISQKSQGLKTSWPFFTKVFKFPGAYG